MALPAWIPEGCPWSELHRLAPPNVKWCEASLCSWITEPANTWSNLFYFLAAFLIYRENRKEDSSLNRNFHWLLIFTGACSFVYHATNNYFTQVLDFAGVYGVLTPALLANVRRLKWIGPKHVLAHVWLGIGVLTLLSVVLSRFGFPFQATAGILIGLILVTEGLARTLKKSSARADLLPLQVAISLLAMGVFCLVIDLSRTWCDPHNHILQGHAAWHMCAAFAAFGLFRYLRQMDDTLA